LAVTRRWKTSTISGEPSTCSSCLLSAAPAGRPCPRRSLAAGRRPAGAPRRAAGRRQQGRRRLTLSGRTPPVGVQAAGRSDRPPPAEPHGPSTPVGSRQGDAGASTGAIPGCTRRPAHPPGRRRGRRRAPWGSGKPGPFSRGLIDEIGGPDLGVDAEVGRDPLHQGQGRGDVGTVLHEVAHWTGQVGDAREALRLYQQVLADRERVQGADHPDTLTARQEVAYWTGQTGEAGRPRSDAGS
jgi:hypothetical protein